MKENGMKIKKMDLVFYINPMEKNLLIYGKIINSFLNKNYKKLF